MTYKAGAYSTKGMILTKKSTYVYSYEKQAKADSKMKFWIKTQITKFWCWLTFADAVYIKMFENDSIRGGISDVNYVVNVRVARRRFDPFVSMPPLSVIVTMKNEKKNSDNRIRMFTLDDNGGIRGIHESNKWTYVNLGKRVERNLKHDS